MDISYLKALSNIRLFPRMSIVMNITKMIGVVQKAESSNTSEALLGAPLHSAFIHSL
jgi:hypothetical protein